MKIMIDDKVKEVDLSKVKTDTETEEFQKINEVVWRLTNKYRRQIIREMKEEQQEKSLK